MKVTQIYNLMNTMSQELLGQTGLVQEDLSNVVDLGKEFFNSVSADNFVRSLSDHIGKMVFVDRVYTGRAPSLIRDGWEYGSILQKISTKLPQATENESWELVDGTSYDPNIFYKPEVIQKFFNDKVTFEIPISITERQVKSAFDNATQLNAFLSMIYTSVHNSMVIKIDGLVMRTLNNMIGETLYADFPSGTYTGTTGVRAINLLYNYNTLHANDTGFTALTAERAIVDPEFIRYALVQIGLYKDRMSVNNSLFNVGGEDRFTPRDRQHLVILSEFYNGATSYLQNDNGQFKNVDIPSAETVPFWQGSGTDYAFSSTSAINIKTSGNHTINASGVLGVLFDEFACGVNNENPRVTTNYNPKGEFWSEWHKTDVSFFNDLNEQMIVFYVA